MMGMTPKSPKGDLKSGVRDDTKMNNRNYYETKVISHPLQASA